MNTHITVSAPMIIGPRLVPAVRIGDAMISIKPEGRTADNRLKVRWFIDVGGKEYSKDDLSSGVGAQWSTATARTTMGNLLGFLSAFAEADDGDENADLFPAELREWAQQHEDDITTIRIEIEVE